MSTSDGSAQQPDRPFANLKGALQGSILRYAPLPQPNRLQLVPVILLGGLLAVTHARRRSRR